VEELVRDLDPGGDAFDDLAFDRLWVSGGFESVLEPGDAVGDVAGLVAPREQHDPAGRLVRREVMDDLEHVEDLPFAEDVYEQRGLQEQALLGSERFTTALGEPLLGGFLAVRRSDAQWAAERPLEEIISAHLWRY
jgi:hypothetical protein